MKNLNNYINESLLDDEEDLINSFDETFYIDEIKKWIRENTTNFIFDWNLRELEIVKTHITSANAPYIVNIKNRKIRVIMKDEAEALTNGMFRWGNLKGDFDCSDCFKLKNLEGAPLTCNYFFCANCSSLEEFKTQIEECKAFNCSRCVKLKNLSNSPLKCKDFLCNECPLIKDLTGITQKLTTIYAHYNDGIINFKGGPIKCSFYSFIYCPNLKNIEGISKNCKELYLKGCPKLESVDGAPKNCEIFVEDEKLNALFNHNK